jgi:transposase-like protein
MWPGALRAKIVAESMQVDGNSEVARRHGARRSQVHEWSKQVSEGRPVFLALASLSTSHLAL